MKITRGNRIAALYPRRTQNLKPVTYEGMSAFSKNMDQLRRQIFGEVVTPTPATNMRVVDRYALKPYSKNTYYTKWYPKLPQIGELMKTLRAHGLYRDEHLDFNEEYERLRSLRGKLPWIPKHKKTGEFVILRRIKESYERLGIPIPENPKKK